MIAHPDALLADDHCLQTLYPPGSCGTFCNQHSYDCYLEEVQQACCEGGPNCEQGRDVPTECPVGCALVFPSFLGSCRDHLVASGAPIGEYESFGSRCLEVDGLALVDYALELRSQGCAIDLGESSSIAPHRGI